MSRYPYVTPSDGVLMYAVGMAIEGVVDDDALAAEHPATASTANALPTAALTKRMTNRLPFAVRPTLTGVLAVCRCYPQLHYIRGT
jgi:hypothetical protein